MQKQIAVRNFEDIKQEALKVCATRSNNGLRGLRVFFRKMDKDGSGAIDPIEFKYGMRDFGLELSELEVTQIVKHFDTNGDGKISFDELLRTLRGSLNERRQIAVNAVWSRIDRQRQGAVELQTLERCFQAAQHPDAWNGERSAEAIMSEFCNAWETQKKNGLITKQEFSDYHTEMGAHIASDEDFEALLRVIWV